MKILDRILKGENKSREKEKRMSLTKSNDKISKGVKKKMKNQKKYIKESCMSTYLQHVNGWADAALKAVHFYHINLWISFIHDLNPNNVFMNLKPGFKISYCVIMAKEYPR